jgi:Secretion system C-terminal sorting domain
MIKRYALSSITVLSMLTASAQYSGPESVEYDAVGDRYFVSNTNNGKIRQRDQAGTVTDFVTVSPSPYGIEIMGDTLFACSGGTVKGYLLSTGAAVFNLNLGGNFLNGITSDGTYLYVTDFGNDEILKVDVANSSFSLLASTTFTPNGIVYDPIGDRLVVVAWGGSASITQVDKNTGALTNLTTTSVSNIDGITIDCLGRFITANWGNDQLIAFEPTFVSPGVNLNAPGIGNPADLDFDEVHGRVCVPNTSSNTVTLFEIAACVTRMEESPEGERFTVFPNPSDGLVQVQLPAASDRNYVVADVSGRTVQAGFLPMDNVLDLSALTSGVYVVSFPSTGRSASVLRR